MSLHQTNSITTPALPPLQEAIYHFLKNSTQSLYAREQLMVELNFTHKGSFTRSLNLLAEQNLIILTTTQDDLQIQLPTATQESLSVTHPTVTPPKQLSPITDIKIKNEPTTHSIQQSLPLTEVVQAKEVEVEAGTPLEIKESREAKKEKKREKEQEKKKDETAKILTNSPTTASFPQQQEPFLKTIATTPTKHVSTPKPTINVTLHPLEAKFNTLNKNTKKLLRFLLAACLEQKSWFLTNYPSHLKKEQLNADQFSKRLQALETAGFIKISGANRCRLTFQISPLELCQQLSSCRDLLNRHQKVLPSIHQSYLAEKQSKSITQPVPQKTPLLKSSTAAPQQTPSPLKTLPSQPQTQPEPEVFSKRYFLLDSENCNQFLSSQTFFNNLKETDTFIIFLSQNSPHLSPAMTHFLLNHAKQIESRYTVVRGKGESDLDHVLTMELAYLWTKDPKAQYVILSKDQGFLASVNYWTQRHQLKKNQLCLKSEV